jgi:hypothetical protein
LPEQAFAALCSGSLPGDRRASDNHVMPSRVAIFAILGLALSRSVFAADPSAPHTPPSWALYVF